MDGYEIFKKGSKIKHKMWGSKSWIEILEVGNTHFFYRDNEGREGCRDMNTERNWFVPYRPPTNKIRIAPALAMDTMAKGFYITDILYPSEEDAKQDLNERFIHWPAATIREYDVPGEKGS